MMLVGGQPGRIYTDTEIAQGKQSVGQRLSVKDPVAGGDKEYVLCCVAASQNLVTGTIVTISGDFVVTVAATGTANTSHHLLGVAITAPGASATASASAYIWVQVYGRTSVRASLSVLPNVGLKIGTVAGVVTDTAAASASAAIWGITLTATSNLANELCAATLTYPRYGTTFAV